MAWTHTYRPDRILPQGTITGGRPGQNIAEAITEIQDRAITDVDLALDGSINGEAVIEGNQLTLRLAVAYPNPPDDESPNGSGGSVSWPTGGAEGMYLRWSASGTPYWDYVRAIDG